MWKLGLRPRYSFSGNIVSKFRYFFFAMHECIAFFQLLVIKNIELKLLGSGKRYIQFNVMYRTFLTDLYKRAACFHEIMQFSFFCNYVMHFINGLLVCAFVDHWDYPRYLLLTISDSKVGFRREDCCRVAIFREKHYFAEHGTDGNFDSFRRNSVVSRNNSVPSHSEKDKQKLGEKHSELSNFVPNHSAED